MPGGGDIDGAIIQWCVPAPRDPRFAGEAGGVAPLDGGPAIGPYLVSYADGKPAHRGQFPGGVLAGIWEKWHPNGARASVKPYASGRGLHGVVTEWWPSGKLASRQTFVADAQHGRLETWHPNGIKRYDQTYRNDRLHGRFREWTDTGVLIKDLSFRDGQEHGRYRTWSQDGVLLVDVTYRSGQQVPTR